MLKGDSIMSFELGEIVVTRKLFDKMKADVDFRKEVYASLDKYKSGDWGDISEKGKRQNRLNIKEGERGYYGTYNISERIWITTKNDRSKTIIMLYEEERTMWRYCV